MGDIKDYILSGVKAGKERFAKEMGIDLTQDAGKKIWRTFINETLPESLDSFVEIIPES